MQLYKNNARALLSRILSILNLDWLQYARSVREVYECDMDEWRTCVTLYEIGATYSSNQDYLFLCC